MTDNIYRVGLARLPGPGFVFGVHAVLALGAGMPLQVQKRSHERTRK